MKTICIGLLFGLLTQAVHAVNLPSEPTTNLVLSVMFTTPGRPVVRFHLQGTGEARLSGVIPNTPDQVNIKTNLEQRVVAAFYHSALSALDALTLPIPEPPQSNMTSIILSFGGLTVAITGRPEDSRFASLFETLKAAFPEAMMRLKPDTQAPTTGGTVRR